MGLSLAGAFDLRGLEAMDLPASLSLRAHRCSITLLARAEDVLQIVLAHDLAGYVLAAPSATNPERPQNPVGALELLCMGIALVQDRWCMSGEG